MPQISHNNMKGTSPSKLIQQGIDQSWNQQNKGTTSPQEAIANKFNEHPRNPGDTKPTK